MEEHQMKMILLRRYKNVLNNYLKNNFYIILTFQNVKSQFQKMDLI